MIIFKDGDMFSDNAEALVNTVNCVGVMGKGIALVFKQLFPYNYRVYRAKCDRGVCKIGTMMICPDSSTKTGKKLIINFPTKQHWRNPSKYEWIELGLQDLARTILMWDIKSIAIPALGCSNGGLDWNKVEPLIQQYLHKIDCDIRVYSPHTINH